MAEYGYGGEQFVDININIREENEIVDYGEVVDNGFVDNGFVNNGFVDNGFVDNGFVDNGFVDNRVEGGFVDNGFVDNRVEGGFVDNGFVDNRVEGGFVDNGFVGENAIIDNMGEDRFVRDDVAFNEGYEFDGGFEGEIDRGYDNIGY